MLFFLEQAVLSKFLIVKALSGEIEILCAVSKLPKCFQQFKFFEVIRRRIMSNATLQNETKTLQDREGKY
ncbi:MAG TPA: hypothetical protein DDX75_05695, partial [Phycisphaerales bacterium]|nr:hypothetical protein [Phycisphaerales bacterium]